MRHYLLAAYLSATGCFVLRSETGLGKGYADLLLSHSRIAPTNFATAT